MYSSINQSDQPNNLEINSIAKDYLFETAKWGKFLGIMGFVASGIMILFCIAYGVFWSNAPLVTNDGFYKAGYLLGYGLGSTIIYILVAIIYFFPALYLYRYATKLKVAIQTSEAKKLTDAFSNQKSLYKFMGIFTIVVLGFYTLILVLMLAGLGIGRLF